MKKHCPNCNSLIADKSIAKALNTNEFIQCSSCSARLRVEGSSLLSVKAWADWLGLIFLVLGVYFLNKAKVLGTGGLSLGVCIAIIVVLYRFLKPYRLKVVNDAAGKSDRQLLKSDSNTEDNTKEV